MFLPASTSTRPVAEAVLPLKLMSLLELIVRFPFVAVKSPPGAAVPILRSAVVLLVVTLTDVPEPVTHPSISPTLTDTVLPVPFRLTIPVPAFEEIRPLLPPVTEMEVGALESLNAMLPPTELSWAPELKPTFSLFVPSRRILLAVVLTLELAPRLTVSDVKMTPSPLPLPVPP